MIKIIHSQKQNKRSISEIGNEKSLNISDYEIDCDLYEKGIKNKKIVIKPLNLERIRYKKTKPTQKVKDILEHIQVNNLTTKEVDKLIKTKKNSKILSDYDKKLF